MTEEKESQPASMPGQSFEIELGKVQIVIEEDKKDGQEEGKE
jgi:hypothetical protein|tara:strand:- start:308 stop:433 length:126 start_codon:yes stop_codon:yes gene_type:complete